MIMFLDRIDIVLTIVLTAGTMLAAFIKYNKNIIASNSEVIKAAALNQIAHEEHKRRIAELSKEIELLHKENEVMSNKFSSELTIIHKRLDDIYKIVAGK